MESQQDTATLIEDEHSNGASEQTKPTKDKIEGEGITVAVRVRPMNQRENRACWRVIPQYHAIAQLNAEGEAMNGTNALFHVDQVFDNDATTTELYNGVCSKVIRSVVNGINGTIFAYGQTSSGKTHTMQGASGSSGVLQLAAEEIFGLIATSTDRTYSMKASYMEIYNENLRDLLSSNGKQEVSIRENAVSGIHIECASEKIECFDDIQKCLRKGEQFRVVGATAMNERSSRSHAIFRLTIDSSITNEHGEVTNRSAALNLVDLAGSESVRNTGATGQRAKEGGKINQSLLALSTVIKQLGDGGAHGGHVNFRDSKLTRLLQPMLLGNATMALICCVTPAEQFAEETRSTLQFATRAKNVRLNPEINEVLDTASQVKKLNRQVRELEEQLASKISDAGETPAAAALNSAEHERLVQELAIAQARIAKHNRMQFSGENDYHEDDEVVDDFSLSKSSKPRGKRHRETWCPGERGVPLPGPMSPQPNPPNRRRLSGLDASESGDSINEFNLTALEAMLEKKSEDIRELEADMQEMYQQLDITEKESTTVKHQLANLEESTNTKIANLGDELEEKNSTIKELQEAYDEMEVDQLDLVNEVKGLKKKVLELEEAASCSVNKVSETSEAQIKLLETASFDLKQTIERLNKEKDAISTDNEGLLEDLEDTQDQLKSTKDEMNKLTLNAEKMNQDSEATMELLKVTQARVVELEENVIKSQSTDELLQKAQSQITELEAKIEAESEVTQTLSTDLEKASSEITALTAKLEESQSSFEQLKGEGDVNSEAKDTRITELEAEVLSLHADINTKVSELEEQIEAKDTQLALISEEAKLKLQNETETMTSKIKELEAKIITGVEDITRFENLLSDQESSHTIELDTLSNELSNLTDQLMERDNELTNMKKSTEEMKIQEALARDEAILNSQTALATELNEVKEELEECKLQLKNDVRLTEENKANENLLERSNNEAQKLRNDLTTRDVELKELRSSHEKLETELRVLKETLNNKLAAQQEDNNQANSKKTNQQAAQISLLQSDLNNANTKLISAETQLTKLNNSMEKKIEKYEKEIHELNLKASLIDDLNFKCKGLQTALSSNESRTKQLQETYNEAMKNEKTLSSIIEKLESEVLTLKQSIEESNNHDNKSELDRLQCAETEHLSLIKQLESDKKSIETRLQKNKTEMDMLREDACMVGELQFNIKQLETKLKESEILLESHDPEYLKQLEESVHELKINISKKDEEILNNKSNINHEIDEWKLKYNENELKINELVNELTESHDENNKKNEEIEDLTQECAAMDANIMKLDSELEDVKRNATNETERVSILSSELNNNKKELSIKQNEIHKLLEKINNLEESEKELQNSKSTVSVESINNAVQIVENKYNQEINKLKEENDNMKQIVNEKDIRIEELDKVKLTQEMKENFTKKFNQLDNLKLEYANMSKELEGAKESIKIKDARIEKLDKVKFTQEHQEQFKKLIQDRDANRKKVKLLNTEVEDLRSRVLSSSSSTSNNENNQLGAENSFLKKQLDDERLRSDQLEIKLSEYIIQSKEFNKKTESANHCVNILKVALGNQSSSEDDNVNLTISDLPQLALNVSHKLNECKESNKKILLFEEQHNKFNDEKKKLLMNQAESNLQYSALKDENEKLMKQLKELHCNHVDMESKLLENKSLQGKSMNDMEKTIESLDREKKFLEQENLQMILENKDYKKQISTIKYEFELLKSSQKNSPGSLAPNAPSSSGNGEYQQEQYQQSRRGHLKTTPLSHLQDKENHINIPSSSSSSSSKMRKETMSSSSIFPPPSAGVVPPTELLNPTPSCVDDGASEQQCQQS